MNVQPTIKFWNGICTAAVVVVVLTLAFDRLVPQPTPQQKLKTRLAGDARLKDQAVKLASDLEKAKGEIESRVWALPPDAVESATLALATKMSKGHALTLSAFRPQKPVDQGELTRLSYVLTLEGPYPGLLALVKELEMPGNRLAIQLVQVASADESSDLVNATVGISAFVEKPKPKTNVKGKNP